VVVDQVRAAVPTAVEQVLVAVEQVRAVVPTAAEQVPVVAVDLLVLRLVADQSNPHLVAGKWVRVVEQLVLEVEQLVEEAEPMVVLVGLHCFVVTIVRSHYLVAAKLPLVVEVQQTAAVRPVTEQSVLEAEDWLMAVVLLVQLELVAEQQ